MKHTLFNTRPFFIRTMNDFLIVRRSADFSMLYQSSARDALSLVTCRLVHALHEDYMQSLWFMISYTLQIGCSTQISK
uniref:Uncharacterized protein n=1 Tax=Anopheles quadriannulatus TaxID=34691 RepID=A0A182XTS5_ANOQN